MKNYNSIFLLLFLIFSISNAFCQKKNTIKGRIFPTPLISVGGIGYERQLTEHSAVQLLFNVIGYSAGSDAADNSLFMVVPEYRYYFNSEQSRSIFTALFSEIGFFDVKPGGEQDEDSYLVNKNGNSISLGLLIGKKIRFSNQTGIEIYFGPKLITKKTYKEEVVNSATEKTEYRENFLWGRVGLNFNYRF